MIETELLLHLLLAGAALLLVLQLVILLRSPAAPPDLVRLLERGSEELSRLQSLLRSEQRESREELAQGLLRASEGMQRQLGESRRDQQQRVEAFGERTDARLEALRTSLAEDAHRAREEIGQTLQRFGQGLDQRLKHLTEHNEARLGEVRATLEARLKDIQVDNARQLDLMRATVDEKLRNTLETRLGESFKLVSERLELVHRGLGEMQNLASGVGDLKRLLGNVKTRGTFGEVQLGMLLEQLLTVEQYASNVATVPGSSERVEFAIRLPGIDADQPVWLPLDAKFPREDYERLLDAQDQADAAAAAVASLALERRVRDEARRIREKYLAPPHTTDFALLYLPTEGLYAEVIRRPGLFENLQREHRVTLAGPSTLTALLNSLQMGFRTLAIEKRSSEVWQLLGAVKSEFGKFAEVLERTRKQLDAARNSIDRAGTRTRVIERKLRDVQTLTLGDGPLLSEDEIDEASDEALGRDDGPDTL